MNEKLFYNCGYEIYKRTDCENSSDIFISFLKETVGKKIKEILYLDNGLNFHLTKTDARTITEILNTAAEFCILNSNIIKTMYDNNRNLFEVFCFSMEEIFYRKVMDLIFDKDRIHEEDLFKKGTLGFVDIWYKDKMYRLLRGLYLFKTVNGCCYLYDGQPWRI